MWFSASVANLLQDLMCYVFRDALLHKSVVTSGDLNFYLTQITNLPGQSVASPGDLLPSEHISSFSEHSVNCREVYVEVDQRLLKYPEE